MCGLSLTHEPVHAGSVGEPERSQRAVLDAVELLADGERADGHVPDSLLAVDVGSRSDTSDHLGWWIEVSGPRQRVAARGDRAFDQGAVVVGGCRLVKAHKLGQWVRVAELGDLGGGGVVRGGEVLAAGGDEPVGDGFEGGLVVGESGEVVFGVGVGFKIASTDGVEATVGLTAGESDVDAGS
jgi:hypothetical protein